MRVRISLVILFSIAFLPLFLITEDTYAEYKFIMKDTKGNTITYDKDKAKIIDVKKGVLYAPVRIVFTGKDKKAGVRGIMIDFEEEKNISKMADDFSMLEIGLQIDLDGYVKFISRAYFTDSGQLIAPEISLEEKAVSGLAVGDLLKVLEFIKRDMGITDIHTYTDENLTFYDRKWRGDVPAIEHFYFHSRKKDATLCISRLAKYYYMMYKPEAMSFQNFYTHLETLAPKLLASCSEGNIILPKNWTGLFSGC